MAGTCSGSITITVPCTPSWVCETPLNGYELDRCGNRRLNSICNPANMVDPNGGTLAGTIVCHVLYNMTGTITRWDAPTSKYMVHLANVYDWLVQPSYLKIGSC